VLILITHTTRHLRRSLLAAAASLRKPDEIFVSCDGDGDDLASCVRAAAAEFNLSVTLVRRSHTGQSRSPQVRNNAVRTLPLSLATETRLVFLDGDCAPAQDCLGQHEMLGDGNGGGRVVVGFRIDLTQEQTEAFDESAVTQGRPPAEIAAGQWAALKSRDRRYRRAVFFRRFGLAKAHKPKILSANFSCTLGAFRAVNGFDEQFIGWGAEDDDLGRRLYQSGVKPAVGVATAIVFHQWHATRAPGAWSDNAGAPRFLDGAKGINPMRAARGLEDPMDQPPCVVERIDYGR
jgi:hypothetical protein